MAEDLKKRIQLLAKNTKKRSPSQKRLDIRTALWPEITDDALWLRTKNDGFTTIPRTLPLISRIMDQLAGKGVPVSSTYLALWCRVFDEAFLEISNPREFAYESGFSGNRAETTWTTRMKLLKNLGFIQSKPGFSGDFHYVLILNPLLVVKKHYDNKNTTDEAYSALLSRASQVGDYSLLKD